MSETNVTASETNGITLPEPCTFQGEKVQGLLPCPHECELVETDSYSNPKEVIHVLECSVCGETCEHVNGAYPRCPHCGAKNMRMEGQPRLETPPFVVE